MRLPALMPYPSSPAAIAASLLTNLFARPPAAGMQSSGTAAVVVVHMDSGYPRACVLSFRACTTRRQGSSARVLNMTYKQLKRQAVQWPVYFMIFQAV